MAKKKNPYQLWLGFDPEISNPNFFQLLGVDPRSREEEAVIQQKATISAKALLKKLSAVEVKSESEKAIKEKLHSKIVMAHETMKVADKRQQYWKALLKKAKTTNKSSLSSTSLRLPVSQLNAPDSSTNNNPPSEIPTAIPMAVPVNTTPVNTAPVAASTATPPPPLENGFDVESTRGGSEPDFSGLDSAPVVKVRSLKRKTSRSWIVPLVILIMLVGGIGGLISMMTKYSNIFELVPGLKEMVATNSQPSDDPTPAVPKAEDDSEDAGSATLTIPELQNRTVEKGDENPEKYVPEDGSSLAKKSEEGATKEGSETKQGSATKPTESGSDTVAATTDAPNEDSGKTLADDKLTVVRLALHRSRDALFRQDTAVARHFNNDAKKILKGLKASKPNSVVLEQRGLVRAVANNDEIITWVNDFWTQVKSSSIEMAGGDDVVVGDKTMGLVEGRDEDVVLRIAGQNEFIPYRVLTPKLALALGDKGSVKSVPRWNLAKATYVGVMSEQYDLMSLQADYLDQAMADGFDLESEMIAEYAKPDWLELGLPQEKMQSLGDSEFEEIIAKERQEMGYEDPEEVSDDRIDALIYQLTLNPRPNLKKRVARLWEAVELIKKGCRTHDLMFVNRELAACCTEMDFERSFVNPILHIAEEKKDRVVQDVAARQTLSFIARYDGDPNFRPELREKLVSLVQKIAGELDNRQLMAMARQLSPQ